MTVRDLIAQLLTFDMEAEVYRRDPAGHDGMVEVSGTQVVGQVSQLTVEIV